MKKILFLIIFFNLFQLAYNQTIKGTIYDKSTKESIGFASVYFNGTFIGAHTDKDGNFELDISKSNSMPLTISAIGYYSVTVTEYSAKKPLLIYMTPKVYEVKEVVVSGKSLVSKRRENMAIFKREFLGPTANGRMCEITNEKDITFNYGHDRDTLKAYASKPVQIENKALGYKMTYYLDKFEYDKWSKTFAFKGNLIFNEDLAKDETTRQAFERKRKNAYLGSRLHFFKSLWADDLAHTGFVLRNSSEENLKYKDIVREEDIHNKYLKYYEPIDICYYSKQPTSRIVFLKDRVYFSGTGYYDFAAISWEGKMAEARIGDWLPYEYSMK